jgi:GDPmannose 4,6-dehydratase
MWKMLQQDMPSDYVIASGKSHTVQDFVDRAFARVRLNPKEHVVVDKRLMRPLEVESLEGDPAKAAKELGWRPRTSFDDLVKIMVDEDVRRWASWKKGELLVWDAPLYPEDSNIIVSRYSLDR